MLPQGVLLLQWYTLVVSGAHDFMNTDQFAHFSELMERIQDEMQ